MPETLDDIAMKLDKLGIFDAARDLRICANEWRAEQKVLHESYVANTALQQRVNQLQRSAHGGN